MNIKNNTNAVGALLILAFLAFGCSFGDINAEVNAKKDADRIETGFNSGENSNRFETERRDEDISSVAGIYEYNTEKDGEGYNNTLEVTIADDGKLLISISGNYIYKIGETQSMHEAEGKGDAVLRGKKADATLVDESGQPCRATISFQPDAADVKIPDTCQFNIALDGVYKKVNAKTEAATENSKNESARLREIGYNNVMDFINDFDARRVGEEFIITDVPAEILDKKNRADAFGNKSYRDLFYLEGVTSDDSASYSVLTSKAMIESLTGKAEYEPVSSLRMTAVIVESKGKFDVYRMPFITKIEGLDNNESVMWTALGGKPARLNFTH